MLWVIFSLMALPVISCGTNLHDSDNSHGDQVGDDPGDLSGKPVDGLDQSVSVIVEPFLIDGEKPPPNPYTQASTPPEYNRIPVFRFRIRTKDGEPSPVNAVLILLPGYGAGATDLFALANDLVELSAGQYEVWIPDRRSNLLEDQTGLDEAETKKDPKIAYDYYFNGLPINGKTFDGFIDSRSPETDMMSEWGLDMQMQDLHQLIMKVPVQNQATNVFIGGHSRGARYAQMYAAYQFEDGHLGNEDIAGIVLIDYMALVPPMTKGSYISTLQAIRKGDEPRHDFSKIGIFAGRLAVMSQITAMAASKDFEGASPELGPDGFYTQWDIMEPLRWFITRGKEVRVTNAAVFGLGIDQDTSLYFNTFYVNCGQVTGGKVSYDALGGYPSEEGATYTWLNFDETEPKERVDIQRLFKLFYAGPSDAVNWYYPTRTQLDDKAVGNLETEGTWRHNYFKFYTSLVDAPVFALAGRVSSESGAYESYRAQLPPVRGTDLPRTQAGFDILQLPDWGHVEVVLVEPDQNPFYEQLIGWVNQWAKGSVQIPRF